MSIRLDAEWTDDCGGKKDYDGDILSISTRYWPRGGGFIAIKHTPGGVVMEGNEARQEIRPSAKSSLVIWRKGGSHITLAEREFEADSLDGFKEELEKWAQEQMDKVVNLLRGGFAFEDGSEK